MLSYNIEYKQRLQLIADYFKAYELYIGEVTVSQLEAWLNQELGNCDGEWQNYGCVLHIISGNTNHAGLHTVLRALLVGGQHSIKLPSEGADEVESCLLNLPTELKLGITWRRFLGEWLGQADVVVAYGSDKTIEAIEAQLSSQQIFIPHGHKVGMAYVDMTAPQAIFDLPAITEGLVHDTVAFNQQGCLSLQVLYVKGSFELRKLLAQELAKAFESKMSERNSLSATQLDSDELSRLAYTREAFALKALSSDSECELWQSDLVGANQSQFVWTVALDDQMLIEQLVGNCWLWVKPWNESIKSEAEFLDEAQLNQTHLSSLAIYPDNHEQVYQANYISWDRVCALGELQLPPLNWKQGKRYNLRDLIHTTRQKTKGLS